MHVCKVYHGHLEYFGLSMAKKTLNYGSLHEKFLVFAKSMMMVFRKLLLKT